MYIGNIVEQFALYTISLHTTYSHDLLLMSVMMWMRIQLETRQYGIEGCLVVHLRRWVCRDSVLILLYTSFESNYNTTCTCMCYEYVCVYMYVQY